MDQLPERAGIDPYNKLIDREPKDNVKGVEVRLTSVVSKTQFHSRTQRKVVGRVASTTDPQCLFEIELPNIVPRH